TAASPDRLAGRERRTTDRRTDLPPTAPARWRINRQSPCACRSHRRRSRCAPQTESPSSRTQISHEPIEQLAGQLAAKAHALVRSQINLDAIIAGASRRQSRSRHLLTDLHRNQCRAALQQALLVQALPVEHQVSVHLVSPRNGCHRLFAAKNLFDNPALLFHRTQPPTTAR